MRVVRRADRVRRTGGLRTGAVAAVGASLALAACGSGGSKSAAQSVSSAAPQQAVTAAIGNLGRASSISVRVSLPIKSAQARQIAAKSGSKLSAAQARALTTGVLFLTEKTGGGEALDSTQARHDTGNSYDLGLSFGSSTPVEFRWVGQSAYLRLDAAKLLGDIGEPTAKAQQFTKLLTQVQPFVPGIGALGRGGWVEVSHSSIQALRPELKQLGQQGRAASGLSPAGLQQEITTLRTDILGALQSDSTFTHVSGSHYTVTLDVKSFVSNIAPDLQKTFGSIPGVGSKLGGLGSAAGSVPAGQKAVVDTYITSGHLTEADIDLNQFAPAKDRVTFAVPIRVGFGTGSVKAPSGATQLDLSKLPGLITGLLGNRGSSAGA